MTDLTWPTNVWSVASRTPVTGTFLFADIAGFTALTEAHGDADAAELALAFCRELSDVARARGGEVVKTIGDAVMVRHADPSQAVELGVTAAHEVLAGHGSPAVRVGMHHGPALSRDGDWFGATVNLAARVAGLAAGGEVLLTGSVRDHIADLPSIRLEPRGEQRVRNMARPVPLFAAVPADAGSDLRDLDPVCHMLVDDAHAVGTLQHGDAVYRFCSLECAGRFARDPDTYSSVAVR
ncbi:MAG TPA: adenylate/guanylate cyclase domain-containing protein [Thermoleophilaceae bacterium]|nr:adenylate/guanylate cyclase domain-containing protein [Thermoleophilaceae bacterium]